jgi:phosphohistidine phosphatase
MALYIVQHGKAFSAEQDPERSLSEEGMAEVRRIADVAKGYGVPVDVIWHSGKKRAQQTAEVYAVALEPRDGLEQREGLGAKDDVVALAEQLDPNTDVMIVGHLPFLERLTSYLIVGDPEHLVFKLQNGGVLCLDRQPDRQQSWFIRWSLMPHVGRV